MAAPSAVASPERHLVRGTAIPTRPSLQNITATLAAESADKIEVCVVMGI